jgi:hypothetical protein
VLGSISNCDSQSRQYEFRARWLVGWFGDST